MSRAPGGGSRRFRFRLPLTRPFLGPRRLSPKSRGATAPLGATAPARRVPPAAAGASAEGGGGMAGRRSGSGTGTGGAGQRVNAPCHRTHCLLARAPAAALPALAAAGREPAERSSPPDSAGAWRRGRRTHRPGIAFTRVPSSQTACRLLPAHPAGHRGRAGAAPGHPPPAPPRRKEKRGGRGIQAVRRAHWPRGAGAGLRLVLPLAAPFGAPRLLLGARGAAERNGGEPRPARKCGRRGAGRAG